MKIVTMADKTIKQNWLITLINNCIKMKHQQLYEV